MASAKAVATPCIPDEWRWLFDSLAASPWRRLVVLGAADRGKSTFCRALTRHLDAAGLAASVLDTDPGQKMLGPPACVTAGAIGAASGGVRPGLYFVGGTDAARRIGGIVAGSARLALDAGERLVVNTGGLVDGPGRVLKRLKLDALRPDRIVALVRPGELDALLAPLPPARLHRLSPAPAARTKSAARRARARRHAFAEALRGAREHEVSGLAVEVLDRDGPALDAAPRLCGLADDDGDEHGLGILRRADPLRGTATVLTPVCLNRVRRLRVGMVLPDEVAALVPG